MSVNLQKGQRIDLKKNDGASLSRVIVGLGWDAAKKGFLIKRPTANIDCDASALLLDANGKLAGVPDIVYYGALSHSSGSVIHQGDNLTGDGDGDDEQICVDLSRVPEKYSKILFVVNIYDCAERGQDFGMIQNAFIRIVDADTNTELCKYNLTENYAGLTAMVFGELYRHNGAWKFNAIGDGTKDTSLKTLSAKYR